MTGFFMLSGFLLYYVYSGKDNSDITNIRSFYRKRAIEILPFYYYASLRSIFFIQGNGYYLDNIILAPIEFLGLQSVFNTLFGISHNGGTWFISCIIICYMVFPFLAHVVKNISVKSRIILGASAAFLVLYSPFVCTRFGLSDIYSNPFFRCLEFLIGIILASITTNMQETKALKKVMRSKLAVLIEFGLLVFGVSLIALLNIGEGTGKNQYMYCSLAALPVFCILLPSLATVELPRVEGSKVISYLCELAFPFFLAQSFVWYFGKKIVLLTGIENTVFRVVIATIICLIMASLENELIVKPCKKLLTGQKLFNRRKKEL